MSSSTATPTSPNPNAEPRDDRFPPGVPYIVGNEAAERFSYYGMRQILYIYLTSLFLGFVAESTVGKEQLSAAKVHATQVTHLFMAGVYLFPMIGAILADRLLGKYQVIFWVSLIYCAGQGALAFAGQVGAMGNVDLAQAAIFAGLTLVAVGSGGIKPCVSANVGDQFTAKNSHLVSRIFQIFYFSINFGSFFASLLTPWLFKRYGAAVAFGVPGVLMALATVVFWMGRNKFVRVPPKPGGKLGLLDFLASSLLASPLLVLVAVGATVAEEIVQAAMSDKAGAVAAAFGHIAIRFWPHALVGCAGFVVGGVIFSVRQKIEQDTGFFAVLLYCWRHRHARAAGEDFWTPARTRFGEEAAEGPPAVFRIIVVFSMVSVFWALFDQHSSTWVEQAKAMNLRLTVPAILWGWWVVPAVVLGALFGAFWLFRWISNAALTRKTTLGVLGALGAWGAVAAVAQLLSGGSQTIDLLPAQIAATNPLMVMIIIPLLNVCVYEPFEKRGRPLKPLTRMGIGMFLAAVSFVFVAILQAQIDAGGKGQIHVLWQFFPYFIITIAEVLVSVTGLEFAYTQAPRAMKSTIMGFWLLCVTFGNILVAFLAPLQRLSWVTFFWTFAALMGVAAVVFVVLAARYKGKTYLQHA
jgi:POT family proton-dependent oligopeptide transporter